MDELVEVIKNAYFISKNIKDTNRLSIIKIKMHKLIPIFDARGRMNFGLWKPLVELMLTEKSVFSKDELTGLDTLCFIIGKYLKTLGNLNFAISIFELGERIEARIGTVTYRWREQIAQCYENLMTYANDGLVAVLQCQKAIDNYILSKNMIKADQLKTKYAELKSSLNLKCIKYNLDMSDIIKFCSDLTDDLLKGDVENIIGFLMNYPNLLPKYQDMDRMAEDHIKKFVFLTIFPGSILDDRGHISEHVATSEEHKYHQILFNYNIAININTIPMLNSILFKAIQHNKLSLDIFINFFKNYSWYGKNISKNLPNGTSVAYNWLNFLVPSLHEYFSQINYYFASGNVPNFMIAIDSLTLKLEGLIRDLCEFNGIKTFYFTKDKFDRGVAREKDITMLLHENEIKNIINEDDLLFFKYLLVEKGGINLRHKIAHSLTNYNEYNINTINLLVLALLRLGRYDFVKCC